MKTKATIGLTGFLVGLGLGLLLPIWKEPTIDSTPIIQPTHKGETHACGVDGLTIGKVEKGFRPDGVLRLKFTRDPEAVLRDILAIHEVDSKKRLAGEYLDVLADKFATITEVSIWNKQFMLTWYDGSQVDNAAEVVVFTDTWKIRSVDFGGGAINQRLNR